MRLAVFSWDDADIFLDMAGERVSFESNLLCGSRAQLFWTRAAAVLPRGASVCRRPFELKCVFSSSDSLMKHVVVVVKQMFCKCSLHFWVR